MDQTGASGRVYETLNECGIQVDAQRTRDFGMFCPSVFFFGFDLRLYPVGDGGGGRRGARGEREGKRVQRMYL